MRVAFGFLLLSAAGATTCDIYELAGTPCVAAHSTVRALFAGYRGALFLVQRASDNATAPINATADGSADSAAQDAFCADTRCTIERIFDQSRSRNHLDTAPGGGAAGEPDRGVVADRFRSTLAGAAVYGAFFEGGEGYRNDNTTGVAVGDEPESMYAVLHGRHFNDKCCFDYGNAEVDALDHGAGTMEAVYWGNVTGWGRGAGAGPWVMADLEDGLWAGDEQVNPDNTPVDADFVTAMCKGRPGGFVLKGGDAQSGPLRTLYDGGRPDGYDPMQKQGAIILGIGGDNSNWAVGTFFEGAMASGFASDATDDAIQANIVAAGYGR